MANNETFYPLLVGHWENDTLEMDKSNGNGSEMEKITLEFACGTQPVPPPLLLIPDIQRKKNENQNSYLSQRLIRIESRYLPWNMFVREKLKSELNGMTFREGSATQSSRQDVSRKWSKMLNKKSFSAENFNFSFSPDGKW